MEILKLVIFILWAIAFIAWIVTIRSYKLIRIILMQYLCLTVTDSLWMRDKLVEAIDIVPFGYADTLQGQAEAEENEAYE